MRHHGGRFLPAGERCVQVSAQTINASAFFAVNIGQMLVTASDSAEQTSKFDLVAHQSTMLGLVGADGFRNWAAIIDDRMAVAAFGVLVTQN